MSEWLPKFSCSSQAKQKLVKSAAYESKPCLFSRRFAGRISKLRLRRIANSLDFTRQLARLAAQEENVLFGPLVSAHSAAVLSGLRVLGVEVGKAQRLKSRRSLRTAAECAEKPDPRLAKENQG